MTIQAKQQIVIDHTNAKIKNWYRNAKIDYDIEGEGSARIEANRFIVDYKEDGVSKAWSTVFYDEYLDFEKNYFYDVWSEEAE